jgi:glutathione S-transferase
MVLTVYGHPFSSYTWKALIALHENATPFEFRTISPDHPDNAAEWLQRWPLRKFPLLVDGDRQVVETSVIIEYLQLAHPGPVRLIPADAMAALDVRFMDRFFDLHVMDAAQHAVNGAISGDAVKRRDGMALSIEKLDLAYAWLETRLAASGWACGDNFTMADCAAAPALFYADWVHRIPESCANLRRYRARLLARPSVVRAVEGARPYRHLFPLGAPDRD